MKQLRALKFSWNRFVLFNKADVLIFFCFASGYFLSFALRQVSAVLAQPMMTEFGLTNAQLGSLSSAYFVSFALMQLPLGLWLDRFGSRKTHSLLLLFAVAGCVLHACATGFVQLWIGRALIGAGVSGALMAALRAFRYLYPADKQQPLAAWMLAIGSMGALSTTLPVQIALPMFGWRGIFWIAAACLLMSAIAIFLLLPKNESTSGAEKFSSYRAIFAEPYLWRFGVLSIVVHGTFVSLQSLWMGPWLVKVVGLTPTQAAQTLFAYTAVLLVGFLLLAKISAKIADDKVLKTVCLSSGIAITFLLLIALLSGKVWWLWFGYAIAGLVFTMIQTHVAMQFTDEQSGRALAAYNLLIFVGAFFAQWLFGVLIDYLKASYQEPEAFRGAMLISVAIQFLALAVTVFWRVQPPKTLPATAIR
jgi:predicted MFS family arabinose efflux permease